VETFSSGLVKCRAGLVAREQRPQALLGAGELAEVRIEPRKRPRQVLESVVGEMPVLGHAGEPLERVLASQLRPVRLP
jgi:hypothetical protein